jgi:hypothetical protein
VVMTKLVEGRNDIWRLVNFLSLASGHQALKEPGDSLVSFQHHQAPKVAVNGGNMDGNYEYARVSNVGRLHVTCVRR